MSLQFIIGNSGAGKSFRAYQRVIVKPLLIRKKCIM